MFFSLRFNSINHYPLSKIILLNLSIMILNGVFKDFFYKFSSITAVYFD